MEYMINNTIEFTVYGKYALFSEPVTRTGGEKNTYSVPTYEAIKGIVKSVYWKPTIVWIVDQIRVMNKIKSVHKSVKPVDWTKSVNQLSIYSYLTDVEYQVRAHFEWNLRRNEYTQDRNVAKHRDMANRWIEHGGRRDIFLGCRECQGYVTPSVFGSERGEYDNSGNIDFGIMFNGFDYPDEFTGAKYLRERYSKIRMIDGIITFDNPKSFCEESNTKDKFVVVTNKQIKPKIFI